MDWALPEEHEELRSLARTILTDRLTETRLREVAASRDLHDANLWADLAGAGLLAAVLPEADGGAGLGLLGTCVLLEEAGRLVAPVPLWAALCLGALPLARFGTAAQRALLGAVGTGDCIVTAALVEPPGGGAATARRDGEGWRLDGVKHCVPSLHLADRVLVAASDSDHGTLGVFLVDPHTSGVRLERQLTTSGVPEGLLAFDGARVDAGGRLGEPGDPGVVRAIEASAVAGLCALASGVTAAALERTAEYTKTRVQFDRPIATFQAVAHRAADAYIDTLAIRLTALQAAWRLDAGLDAERELAIAKFWASEGGQRVVHAAQHLHGGIGVDVDYPLHRYFLAAKWIELTLGGATEQLLRLADLAGTDHAAGVSTGEVSR